MPLGIVVGLAGEARIARRLGAVEVGGGTPVGAAAAAERAVAGGATALLSFGLAGGLDPNLRPGDRVVPVAVLQGGARFYTDADLCRALGGANVSLVLGGDRIVAGARDKRALSESSGASAVDLESGAVALVAARHGMPFAVLRAICDPASRSLPLAAVVAVVAVDQRGAVGALRVLGAVAARPWQIPGLLLLAVDAARARHTLVRAAAALLARLDGR
jgi:adenosylhomocysteine nucleosidase